MDTMFPSRYYGGATSMIVELSQRKMRNQSLGVHSKPRHIVTVAEEVLESFKLEDRGKIVEFQNVMHRIISANSINATGKRKKPEGSNAPLSTEEEGESKLPSSWAGKTRGKRGVSLKMVCSSS